MSLTLIPAFTRALTLTPTLGESDIGHETQDGDVDQCGQKPYPFHISFCGDIDNAGHQKPQA